MNKTKKEEIGDPDRSEPYTSFNPSPRTRGWFAEMFPAMDYTESDQIIGRFAFRS